LVNSDVCLINLINVSSGQGVHIAVARFGPVCRLIWTTAPVEADFCSSFRLTWKLPRSCDRVCKNSPESTWRLFFEKPVGYDIPVLINAFGSEERHARLPLGVNHLERARPKTWPGSSICACRAAWGQAVGRGREIPAHFLYPAGLRPVRYVKRQFSKSS